MEEEYKNQNYQQSLQNLLDSIENDKDKINVQQFINSKLRQFQEREFQPFKIERYFAIYEFTVKYLLSCSDCESLSLKQILSMADEQSLNLWENLSLSYTESQVHPEIANELLKFYNEDPLIQDIQNCHKIEKNNIIEVVPEEGIFLSMFSLLKNGDHVVAVSPIYQSLIEIARFQGCQISLWEVEKNEKGEAYFDIQKLQKLIQPNTKLVVVNFPHNPTGYIPSQQDYNKIVELCQQNNSYLFSDEMYRGLQNNDSYYLKSGCQVYEKSIVLSGMSKTYSMPGLRFGWLVIRDQLIMDNIIKMKDYTTICHTAPSQILSLIGLKNQRQIAQQNIKLVTQNLEIFDKFCQKNQNVLEYLKPQGGSTCLVKMKNNVSSSKYGQYLANKHELMILPGNTLNCNDDFHFRIGLGRKNFQEVLEFWDQLIQKENDWEQFIN